MIPRWWWILLVAAISVYAAWDLVRQPRKLVLAGLSAYDQGDFPAAVVHFEQALARRSSAVLLRDLGLAYLQTGDLERAAEAADALAASGRADDLAWRDFLLGNLAWSRSGRAEIQAHGPLPPAGALQRAIAHTVSAREAWQSALESRSDWPAASRNLERADVRLDTLRAEQQADSGAETVAGAPTEALPDRSPAALDPAQQQRLMQQLQRLDLQRALLLTADRAEPEGGWKW